MSDVFKVAAYLPVPAELLAIRLYRDLRSHGRPAGPLTRTREAS